MKHWFIPILLMISAVFRVAAGTEDLFGKPVRYVRILSDYPLDKPMIRQAVSIREGDIWTPQSARRSLRNLSYLNLLRQVTIQAEPFEDGVAVILNIEPEWHLRKIRFKGKQTGFLIAYGLESRVSLKELQKSVRLVEGEVFSEKKLNESIASLKKLYAEYGYADCQITPRLHYRTEHREIDLTFRINKGKPTLIRSVVFKGREKQPVKKLLSAIKSRPGRRFNYRSLTGDTELLRHYYMKKDFLFVQIKRPTYKYDERAHMVDITFDLVEGDQAKIELKSPTHLWNVNWWIYKIEPRPSTILDILDISGTDYIDKDLLENGLTNVVQRYQDRGYAFTVGDLENVTEAGVDTFRYTLSESPKVEIQNVEIQGTTKFSEDDLKSILFSRPGSVYFPTQLESDREQIISLYHNAGFNEVQVHVDVLQIGGKKVDLQYRVDEGSAQHISSIVIHGNSRFSDEEIQGILGISPEDPLNSHSFGDRISTLKNDYIREGYSDVIVNHALQQTGQESYSVEIDIVEGIAYRFADLIIKGNRRTPLSLIKRDIPNLTGTPFSKSKVLEVQRSISKLGLFSSIKSNTMLQKGSKSDQTLLVTVREQAAMFLEAGPGYNTDIGFSGYVRTYTNSLFGTNRYLGLSVFLAEEIEKSQVTYREPEFSGYPIQMELRLFRNITDESHYKLFRYGGRVNWTYRLSTHTRIFLEYRLDSDKPIEMTPGTSIPLEYRNTIRIASLAPGLLLDTRDDPRDPHAGSLLTLKIEFARPVYGGEVDFTKTIVEAVHFLRLFEDQTIGISFRGGWGRDLPYQEKFKLGGIKTLRGWGFEDIRGPKPSGLLDIDLDANGSGGELMGVLNLELRTPLFWGLQGVLFVDTGNVWTEWSDIHAGSLKSSVGLGVRFLTPIGPVGVDYAHNIIRKQDDPHFRWSFVIGHTF